MKLIRVLEPLVISDILRRRGELVLVPDDWDDPAAEVRMTPAQVAAVEQARQGRLDAARAAQAERRANADHGQDHGQGQGQGGGQGNPPGQQGGRP